MHKWHVSVGALESIIFSQPKETQRAKVTGCFMIAKAVAIIFNKKFHRYLTYIFVLLDKTN